LAHRNKEKEGNGAGTQARTDESRNLPARWTEPAGWPMPMAGHPLSRLRDEIDTLFDRFFGFQPAPMERGWGTERMWDIDVDETDKEIRVRAEAPGFEPQDFDIRVSGNLLTIRAEHKQEKEEKHDEGRSWERRYGRFQRSMTLPAAVKAEQVDAHYRNGVLELRLPRAEEAQRKRIEVKG